MLDLAHVARVEGTNADLCKGPWLVAPAFGVEGDNNHVLGKGRSVREIFKTEAVAQDRCIILDVFEIRLELPHFGRWRRRRCRAIADRISMEWVGSASWWR